VIKITAQSIEQWQEVVRIGIEIMDGSEVQYAGIVNDIPTFPELTKDIEGQPLANGGRRVKWTPSGDLEFTFKIFPINCELTGEGMKQLFDPQDSAETAPFKVVGTRNRNVHQIMFLWAEDIEDLATAGAVTTSDKAAWRMSVKNAYCTKYQDQRDDLNIMAEVTFKCAPFGKTANANYKNESTTTTAIPAKAAFTTANRYDAY